MTTTSVVNQPTRPAEVNSELSLDQLAQINGGLLYGITAPAAVAFAAGYAVGTVIYKHCGWARWV
jgi:lactobin A/cerein 7B family class IIb bacteriocin